MLSAALNNRCLAQHVKKKTASHETAFFLHGKISLDSLKDFVHLSSNVRFSFNSSKVKGSKEIYFSKGYYSLPALLRHISKTTSLYYAVYNGYIVFGDHPPRAGNMNTTATAESKQRIAKKIVSDHKHVHGAGFGKNEKGKKTNAIKSGKDSLMVTGKPLLTEKGENSFEDRKDSNSIASQKTISKFPDSATGKNKKLNKTDTIYKSSGKPVVTKKDEELSSSQEQSPKSVRNRAGTNAFFSGVHYGIEWNFAIPISGFKDYFLGTNASSQPYYLFIPALWLSRNIGNKITLHLDVKVMQSYYTGKIVLKDTLIHAMPGDSNTVQQIWSLSKTFGTNLGFQYEYHINDKFLIGAGVVYYWQNASIVHLQSTWHAITSNSQTDSTYGIKKSSGEWQYVRSSILLGKLQMAYHLERTDIGASLQLPFSGFSMKNASMLKALNLQVFVRFRIQ